MNHERSHFPLGTKNVWRQEQEWSTEQDQGESICEARGENKAEADDPKPFQGMAEINQDTEVPTITPPPTIKISAIIIDTALSHQGRSYLASA